MENIWETKAHSFSSYIKTVHVLGVVKLNKLRGTKPKISQSYIHTNVHKANDKSTIQYSCVIVKFYHPDF